MNKKPVYIRTTFYLKPELKERIQKEALKQRRTITEVINWTIEEHLKLWDLYESEQLKAYTKHEIGKRIIAAGKKQ